LIILNHLIKQESIHTKDQVIKYAKNKNGKQTAGRVTMMNVLKMIAIKDKVSEG